MKYHVSIVLLHSDFGGGGGSNSLAGHGHLGLWAFGYCKIKMNFSEGKAGDWKQA